MHTCISRSTDHFAVLSYIYKLKSIITNLPAWKSAPFSDGPRALFIWEIFETITEEACVRYKSRFGITRKHLEKFSWNEFGNINYLAANHCSFSGFAKRLVWTRFRQPDSSFLHIPLFSDLFLGLDNIMEPTCIPVQDTLLLHHRPDGIAEVGIQTDH